MSGRPAGAALAVKLPERLRVRRPTTYSNQISIWYPSGSRTKA